MGLGTGEVNSLVSEGKGQNVDLSPPVIFNTDSLLTIGSKSEFEKNQLFDILNYIKILSKKKYKGFKDLSPEKLLIFKQKFGLYRYFLDKISDVMDSKRYLELREAGKISEDGVLQAGKHKGGKVRTREEILRDFEDCGEYGEQQESKRGEQRIIIYNCQERAFCPRCNELYHSGLAVKNLKLIKGILKAKAGSWVSFVVFTLPDWLTEEFVLQSDRRQKEIRQKLFEISRQILAEFFEPQDGLWGGYQCFHPWSSKNPFKSRWHIHAAVLGVYLSGDTSCPGIRGLSSEEKKRKYKEMRQGLKKRLISKSMDDQARPTGYVDPEIAGEKIRVRWKEKLKQTFPEFYQQAPPDDEQKEYNVHYSYRKRPTKKRTNKKGTNKKQADWRGISHDVHYCFRSFWQDIFEAIRSGKTTDEINTFEADLTELCDNLDQELSNRLRQAGQKMKDRMKVFDREAMEILPLLAQEYSKKQDEFYRFFGFLSKGSRRRYLPKFGLKLKKEEKFEVQSRHRFCIFNRNREKIWVNFEKDESDKSVSECIDRENVQDEQYQLSGQIWERGP